MAALPHPATEQTDLVELLTVLTDRAGVSVSPQQLAEAVDRCDTFEAAASSVGLRIRWHVATVDDAAPLARRDMPVVTWGAHGACWVLDGVAGPRFRAFPIDDPRLPRWMSLSALRRHLGDEARPWALVEAVLPGAPLASPHGPRSPLRRLGSLLWMERRDGGVVILYGTVAGLLSLATPLAIQVLINWLAFGALLQPIFLLGVALLTCLALAAGLQLLQRVAVETIERRIFVRMVADLSGRLARVKASALDGLHGPELANRFFDVLTLQKAASTLLLDGFTALLQVVVAVTLLALYHPLLLVFDLVLVIGMAVTLIPLGRGAQATAIAESKSKYAVAAWIEEIARHPVALRMNDSQIAERKAERLARTWLEKRRAHFSVFLRQYAGVQALQVLMSVVLLVACGALVLRGQLTVGQLVAAEFIVNAALMGFAKFADKLDTIYDLIAGVDKLGTLLDLPPEQPVGVPRGQDGAIRVELSGATLRYPDGGGLPPVDLELPAGSHTIVLGAPSTGKSTLGQLAVGLRNPAMGSVRHDGELVSQLRPEDRYRNVALLRPDDLVHGTVRENVTMGRVWVDDRRVWEVLEATGLRPRIESLRLGLDTVLGPTGAPLSDIDQRALLVARSLVCPPRLLVVDGVLDGLPHPQRTQLRDLLTRPSAPWTLLILTSDARVPAHPARLLTLDHGGLDERPPLAPA